MLIIDVTSPGAKNNIFLKCVIIIKYKNLQYIEILIVNSHLPILVSPASLLMFTSEKTDDIFLFVLSSDKLFVKLLNFCIRYNNCNVLKLYVLQIDLFLNNDCIFVQPPVKYLELKILSNLRNGQLLFLASFFKFDIKSDIFYIPYFIAPCGNSYRKRFLPSCFNYHGLDQLPQYVNPSQLIRRNHHITFNSKLS